MRGARRAAGSAVHRERAARPAPHTAHRSRHSAGHTHSASDVSFYHVCAMLSFHRRNYVSACSTALLASRGTVHFPPADAAQHLRDLGIEVEAWRHCTAGRLGLPHRFVELFDQRGDPILDGWLIPLA